MKCYLVEVKTNIPYPIKKDYRIECSSFGTAISRAIKLFRKDKGKKKINELNINAKYVCNTQTLHSQVD